MDNIKYIVAPHRSIATKVGIKGPGEEVTPKIIGNWTTLISKGWIVEDKPEVVKTEEQKKDEQLAKPERIVELRDSEKEPEENEKSLEDMTKKEIQAELKEKGIDFNDRANKKDLLKLLKEEPKTDDFGAKKAE